MSDERSEPLYNLRSKRVKAPAGSKLSEGFIRASELLRRTEELGLGGDHEATQVEQEGSIASQELVPDLPPNRSDEGASERATEEPSQVEADRDQGVPDSSREAQGQQPSSPHRLVAEQAAEDSEQEVLRLRVRVSDPKTHRVQYVWIPVNMLI